MAENTTPNFVNSILIIRNDLTANWEKATYVLKKGELAIEYCADGKVKLKAGGLDSATAWADLPYIGGDESHVYQSEILPATNTDDDVDYITNTLVGTDVTPNKGDIAIVKRAIVDAAEGETPDKVSHTAYVYDGANWAAMDGNYSADNIYFDSDMLVTKEIGYITISSGQGTIPSKGKNLPQVFEAMFVKEQDPENPTKPSISASLKKAGNYEAGTPLTGISYSFSFNDGDYSYGPEPTGAVVSGDWTITDSDGATYTNLSGNLADRTVIDGTNYSLSASVNHTAGDVPFTNKGNLCTDSTKQIKADKISNTTSAIKGYRPWFYGYFANNTTVPNPEQITSAQVRALNLSNGTSNTSLPATFTTNAYRQMFFAIPQTATGGHQQAKFKVLTTTDDTPAGTMVGPVTIYVKGYNNTYVADDTNKTAVHTTNGWAYDLFYIMNEGSNDGATWKIVKDEG